LNAAIHPNASIEVVASFLLGSLGENWRSYPSDYTWSPIENKCDKYLSNLGWNEETLAATPLLMKLEVIA